MRKEMRVVVKVSLISVNLEVPLKHVGDFLLMYAKEFADKSSGELGRVDDYFPNEDAWSIDVSVGEDEKDKLYKFIRNFSKEKNLNLKDADWLV